MTRNEFLLEMDEILGLNPGTLKGDEKFEDLESLDSTVLVSLIAMAESRSNQEITLDQAANCSTVADLLRLVTLEGQPRLTASELPEISPSNQRTKSCDGNFQRN